MLIGEMKERKATPLDHGHGKPREMRAIHYIDGRWHEGNPPILGPMSHATWMASVVFDGARAFEGVAPDLDLHCKRAVESAANFGLKPMLSAGEVLEIAEEGRRRFAEDAELYIRPMFWAEEGFVVPDPNSTRFCCTLFEAPMPKPKGTSVHISSRSRPLPHMAPTHVKAACLYPNSAAALAEAHAQGFDNAVILDAEGNIAELATANIWIGKDGQAMTPVPNGTFLNGITKQRVAGLLEAAGIPVKECTITVEQLMDADEIFLTGNLGKVMPITRIEDRDLQPGPIYSKARQLYWDWAHGRQA